MKSTVFTQAWNLVKNLGYTLSQALKLAWSAAKVSKLANEQFKLENEAFGFSKNKSRLSQIKLELSYVVETFAAYKNALNQIVTPTCQSNGAQVYYNQSTYNGD